MSFADGTAGGYMEIELWIALGADTSADPSTWVFNQEVTGYGLDRAGIRITFGMADEQQDPESCTINFDLFNTGGIFTARNPMSAFYPYLRQGIPIMVRFAPNGVDFYEFVGLTSSLASKWDVSQKDQWVPVTANGTLKGPSSSRAAKTSNLNLFVSRETPGLSQHVSDYWPLEDGTFTNAAGSGLTNGQPLRVRGRVDFATDSGPPGSGSLPSKILATAGELRAAGQMVSASGNWYIGFVYKAEVAAGQALLQFEVPGHSKYSSYSITYTGGEGPPSLSLEGLGLDGVEYLLAGTSAGDTETWHSAMVICEVSGGSARYYILVDDIYSAATTPEVTSAPGVLGVHNFIVSPVAMDIDTENPPPGLSFGHLWAAPSLPDTFGNVANKLYKAMLGNTGERAVDRFVRECGYLNLTPSYTDPDRYEPFSTPVSASWGTTPWGQAWSGWGAGGTVNGSDFNVASGVGTHSVPVANAYRYTYLDSFRSKNQRVSVQLPSGVGTSNVTGGQLEIDVMLRVQSGASRYYHCRVAISVAEAVTLTIHDTQTGQIGANPAVLAFTNTNQALTIKAQIVDNVISVKCWPTASAEPAAWDLTETPAPHQMIRKRGGVGIRSGRAVSNSNTSPYVFSYDNFTVYADDYLMGPRGAVTGFGSMCEVARSTGGVLYELPDGQIRLDTAQDRLDLAVTLSLDYAAGDVSPPFEPVEDDALTINDSVANRPDGATARFTLTEGPMSSASTAPGVGLKQGTVDVNPYNDRHLIAFAGNEVTRGTVDRERYPAIRIDCHAHPELIEEAMAAARPSRRIQVVNLPTAQGYYNDADLIVEGGEIFVDFYSLDVMLNAVPYHPYVSFGLVNASGNPASGGQAGWLVPTTCVLAEALDTTETGVDITSVPLWETDSTNYPVNIDLGGEEMRVTACSGAGPNQTLTVVRSINGVVKSHAILTTQPIVILAPGILTMEA